MRAQNSCHGIAWRWQNHTHRRPRSAAVFNGDAVPTNFSRDLGFVHPERVEHARRMGWVCDCVAEAGGTAIADFVCPTEENEDTNRMFNAPSCFDLRVSAEASAQYWAEQALVRLCPPFDPQRPTALFLGHYQPFSARSPTAD
jgi:hypothetical protein